MKLYIFVASIVILQVIHRASSQSISELIFDLIVLNEDKRSNAENEVNLQHQQTRSELKRQFKEKVAPSLIEVKKEVEDYIEKMINETSSAGYNTNHCVELFEDALTSQLVPNVTEKAISEITVVFEPLLARIERIALHNLGVIANEVDSIANDYALCIKSEAPEYCNGTLSTRVLSKQEELPLLYNKEAQRTTIAYVEQVVDYESRTQDYIQEAVTAIRPYLNLMENCVSAIVSTKK